MSKIFHANQYEGAFKMDMVSNKCSERPRSRGGFSHTIANGRGHLTESSYRSATNPWGNFVGTWDLPKKIPSNFARVGTARTTYAQQQLQMETESANRKMDGRVKNDMRNAYRAMGDCKGVLKEAKESARVGANAPATKMMATEGTTPPRLPADPAQMAEEIPKLVHTPVKSPLMQENRSPTPPVKSPVGVKEC